MIHTLPGVSSVVLCIAAASATQVSQAAADAGDDAWIVDSQVDWEQAIASSVGLEVNEGLVTPIQKQASLRSVLQRYEQMRSAQSVVIEQAPAWLNWDPIENLGPVNLADAPVLLSLGPDDYWMFGRYGDPGKRESFTPVAATLDGFDIPLQTTPFPNQFDAPGGLMQGRGGYHAWQSRDMVNWVHHGPVTEQFSRWVTTAEYVDGRVFIYYDYPNDQDPHVYLDDDLTDGVPGQNMGLAFRDPSHGSDCAMIRDFDGRFHVIYEDWTPINASERSWDSPLAGHAVSDSGVGDFSILDPAVDHRTTPTGEIATYKHPHWMQHPNWNSNIAEYEVHDPEQEAFGDWAAICIGGQYYLFGDYDPVGGHQMSIAWFTSNDINESFTRCGNLGNGHPDPDICFAEGRFYLATQQDIDYVSPGPWVERVEIRVGVDTDNNQTINAWTVWQDVRETYDYIPGFAKQIRREPAALDLSELPAGFAFQFEIRLTDTTQNRARPELDRIQLVFD